MLYIDIKVGDLMDDIKYMGLTYQQVEERKQRGLINISHDNISKTKKKLTKNKIQKKHKTTLN